MSSFIAKRVLGAKRTQLLRSPQTMQELGKKAKRKVRKKKTETQRPLSRQFPSLRAFGDGITPVQKHFPTRKQNLGRGLQQCLRTFSQRHFMSSDLRPLCTHTAQSPGSPCSMQVCPADNQIIWASQQTLFSCKEQVMGPRVTSVLTKPR